MSGLRLFALLLATQILSLASVIFARSTAEEHLKKPDDWYRTPAAASIAANILSHQSPLGGWPKNTDTTSSPYTGDPAKLTPTFDNGATTDELRFLARAFQATHENLYQQAFLKGLDYILKAQYPTGGWPQFYPPSRQYHRHITFNDRSMVRLMEFLREVARSDSYSFVDAQRRVAAREAFDRGIQCILKCQIKVNGKLTAWCAQHDENDYAPRSGRSYELVSLSGAESVDIVKLLMTLENPTPQVVQSIDAAAAWFESAKLQGIKVVYKDDPKAPKGKDKVVVNDPAAAPMWARFYEIGANRPIFCDRDGVPRRNLSEIGYERRNGYAWLGYWPQDLLAKDYPAWKAKLRGPATAFAPGSPTPTTQPASNTTTPRMMYRDASRLGRPFAKDPAVVHYRGRYLMYYSLPPYDKAMAPPGAPAGWAIGIADSADLVQWKKIGQILPEQECEAKGICAPGATVIDGKVHLFYQTYGNAAKDAICHAVSDDGIHFARDASNPVFRPTGAWNCGRAIDADVIEHNGKLLLYCATRDPQMKIQMLVVAAADKRSGFGRDAWKQLCDAPILRPELPWEQTCIEAPALCSREGKLYMFYGGAYNNAPQQIGCAVSSDGSHWQRLSDQPFLPNGHPGEWNSSESGHPFAFTDDGGQVYLFYQGNADKGRSWYLSNVRIGWRADGPYPIRQ